MGRLPSALGPQSTIIHRQSLRWIHPWWYADFASIFHIHMPFTPQKGARPSVSILTPKCRSYFFFSPKSCTQRSFWSKGASTKDGEMSAPYSSTSTRGSCEGAAMMAPVASAASRCA